MLRSSYALVDEGDEGYQGLGMDALASEAPTLVSICARALEADCNPRRTAKSGPQGHCLPVTPNYLQVYVDLGFRVLGF